MQLILMRHGVAVERDEWEGDDFHRPLTKEGEAKTREAARGLSRVCAAPQLLASSPKIRAMQTVGALHEVWKTPGIQVWPELMNPDLDSLMGELRQLTVASVCMVGHEPELGRFASLLLVGDEERLSTEWKKAGALCLELDLARGSATLQWMVTPRILRALGSD